MLFAGLSGIAGGVIVQGVPLLALVVKLRSRLLQIDDGNQVVRFGHRPGCGTPHSSHDRTGDIGGCAIRPSLGGASGHALWDYGHPYGEWLSRGHIWRRPGYDRSIL